jgi:hypothetical protein
MFMHTIHGGARNQLASTTQKLLQDPSTCFEKVLSAQLFQRSLEHLPRSTAGVRLRAYPPLVTLWIFMIQALSPDSSCRAAVARWIAHMSQAGEKLVSSATGGYCRARKRISLDWIRDLTEEIGTQLELEAHPATWRDLHVLIADGTQLNIQDTAKNCQKYPKRQGEQARGLPKLQLVGIFSLVTGALLKMKMGPIIGVGSGESSVLRQMLDTLEPKTLLLADRAFGGYFCLVSMLRRGTDFIVRKSPNHYRITCRERRLGRNDHLIRVHFTGVPPRGVPLSWVDYLPEKIALREIRVNVHVRGFRAKTIDLVTSLLDPKKFPADEIRRLFAERWNIEVDFRVLKSTLGMNVLRCKDPTMVQKEVWAHLFGYNVIRLIMMDAAYAHGKSVRELSFKETLQLALAFEDLLWGGARSDPTRWQKAYTDLLTSIRSSVRNRPGRIEPRLLKYRPKRYGFLKQPRAEARYGFWRKGDAGQQRRADLATT